MPRPKPSARAAAQPPAPPPSKPKAKPAAPTVTPADKVRREWAQFEGWVAAQRKEAAGARESELLMAKQQMEMKKRGLPRGFHSKLVKEFENTKRKAERASERVLADRFLAEWEARLGRAGLNLEDWDPMTPADQEAVRSVLEGPSDDEADEAAAQELMQDISPPPVAPQAPVKPAVVIPDWRIEADRLRMQPPPIAPPAPVKPAVAIPDWSAEADRLRGLSPLPDVPDWNRPYTPHPAQQHAPRLPSPPPPPQRESKDTSSQAPAQAGPRYTGPVLLEEHAVESLEDADFRAFKLSVREQMIREFHEEAITLEVALVRQEQEARLEPGAIKSLLACHDVDVEELRQMKEDKRKAIVDAERTKRKAELRRRALQAQRKEGEGQGLHQPVARKAAEKPPFQKTNSSGWGAGRDMTGSPLSQRPMAMAEKPSSPKPTPSMWGSLWGGGEQAKEPPPPPPGPMKPPTPPAGLEMPGALSFEELPPVAGKGAVLRGKKAKAGKKGAPAAPAPIPVEAEEAPLLAPPMKALGKDKFRGAAKTYTPPKPTVEDVSDEDASANANTWARSEAQPKNDVDELAELFFKQASAAVSSSSSSPFSFDEEPSRATRPGKGKTPTPAPVPQWYEASNMHTPSSAVSEMSDHWGPSASSGAESTSDHSVSEQHAVWKPSVVSLDSDEEDDDDDGDDGGFLSSLAGGLVAPEEYRPPAAAGWGGASRPAAATGGGNPYAKNMNAPPVYGQGRYDPRWGGPPAKVGAGRGHAPSHRSPAGVAPVVQDDWENQMMGKYLGFAQGSGRY
ncbi:hypothetical protein FIBSPDRAFT_858364 [Athelia psychrophila]|uniref:Uncharacterized protein n=1 Tax=Athelia psychrophila TaxID=1759441 RepID=A0A166LXN1_9AGAM|nr:hypothetical protein FIBSPDRAFT_858364 [Fibularhizoctonia sp. CBS 109695]